MSETNYLNKYDLISNIISLMYDQEYPASIKNLSKDCNIPLQYTRKAVLALYKNRILNSCIVLDDELNDEFEDSFSEDFIENPETITNKLLSGDFDEMEWSINLRIMNSNDDLLLPLSHIEYGEINNMGHNIPLIKNSAIFRKKDTVAPVSSEVQKNRENLADAIAKNKAVEFNYRKSNGIERVRCFPSKFTFNDIDKWIYINSVEGKTYRLDKIVQLCRIINDSDISTVSNKNTDEENRKYVWGTFYSANSKPEHVVLKIAPETNNIIEKIRRDIEYRSQTCKFYKDGDFYYYEDDIIGMFEFHRWVRGYGSSIVVLEPEQLREDIKKSACLALEKYEISKSWKTL